MAIKSGDRIGDYEVIGSLGSGGMGHVFRVRHAISHRVEAMKVLLPGRATGEEMAERFLREIRLLASLDHPNIASLHNAFHHDGQLVMVMELIEGETLRAKLAVGVMMEKGLDYVKQVLAGLEYAHQHGIIHRDIKPSNIMAGAGDRAKLLDFGLAFPVQGPEFTRSGTVLGSLHYMSPEQVMGKQLDARSDIYSLGVTLYEILTGRLPFDGVGDYAIANSHLNTIPVIPMVINPRIPGRISEIVMTAMAKAPEARFQSAGELASALVAAPNTLHSGETVTQMLPVAGRGISSDGAGGSRFDQAVLEAVSRDLAHHIGPIAHVVVRRAAKRVSTVDELYAVVGEEIEMAESRSSFLATRRKHSTIQ